MTIARVSQCVLGGFAEEGYCLGDQFPECYSQTSPRAKRLMHKSLVTQMKLMFVWIFSPEDSL